MEFLKEVLKSGSRVVVVAMFTYFFLSFPFLRESSADSVEPRRTIQPPDEYSTPTKAEGVKYNRFKKAFEKSWRQLKIDDAGEEGPYERARGFVEPLPVWDVRAVCDGQDLFWFDFLEYKVISKENQVVNLGAMYTGSAGTERILFGLDQRTNSLRILFRENVLDFLGQKLTKTKEGSNCPDFTMAFSGYHFKTQKNNYDGDLDTVSYQRKTKKYVARKIRLKSAVTPDDKNSK
jgi:hypothetical protein